MDLRFQKPKLRRNHWTKKYKKGVKKQILFTKPPETDSARKFFWEKCLGQNETIVLVQTNQNSVIGGYCPDQWIDTTQKKNYFGTSGYKDIVSGKPFLFYFLDDQIQIMKHSDDQIPYMRSNKDYLMFFEGGLEINSDKN